MMSVESYLSKIDNRRQNGYLRLSIDKTINIRYHEYRKHKKGGCIMNYDRIILELMLIVLSIDNRR